MKAGLFYKHSINIKKQLDVTVFPETGSNDCNMGIYTAENSWLWGWTGCDHIGTVSSVKRSNSTYKKTGKIDGVYFRNWTGNKRWTGRFTLTY